MLALIGVYRDGWRRPLEAVEVWDGLDLLGIVSRDLLRALVCYHIEGMTLSTHLSTALRRSSATPPWKARAIGRRWSSP